MHRALCTSLLLLGLAHSAGAQAQDKLKMIQGEWSNSYTSLRVDGDRIILGKVDAYSTKQGYKTGDIIATKLREKPGVIRGNAAALHKFDAQCTNRWRTNGDAYQWETRPCEFTWNVWDGNSYPQALSSTPLFTVLNVTRKGGPIPK
jgi:hypothetical protein